MSSEKAFIAVENMKMFVTEEYVLMSVPQRFHPKF